MAAKKPAAAAPLVPGVAAPRGRPSVYTKDLGEQICRRIASGESLKSICRCDSMPGEGTVRGWVLDDRDSFSALYARARTLQAERWADEIVDIADDGTNDYVERLRNGETLSEFDAEHVQRSKLRVDARKWMLSKLLRKTYGDRSEVDVTVRKAADEMTDDELDAAIAAERTRQG